MTSILATYPDDIRKENERLKRRNAFLQRQNESLLQENDALKGIEREHANTAQRNAQRTAQRNGRGFAGCGND